MGDYLQEIGSFRTILHSEFQTHFKTCALQTPWETPFKPKVGDYPNEIVSFRTILNSGFQTHFKTPVNHMSHSVNGLLSRPFGRGKEHRSHCSTVLVTFGLLSRPCIRNQEDTGHRISRQIIHHHHHTIEGT